MYNDVPCHGCLKYAMCNSRLKNELKDEKYNVQTVIIIEIILKCSDYERYIDDILDRLRDKDGSLPRIKILDDTIASVTTETFSLDVKE